MPAQNRRWATATYLTSCAVFAGTLAALGVQVKAGADPVVGAAPADVPPRPKLVITRRVVRTTVITQRVVRRPSAPAPGLVGGAAAAAPAAPGGGASSVAAPASVAAAPAPTPAPAPPTTRAS